MSELKQNIPLEVDIPFAPSKATRALNISVHRPQSSSGTTPADAASRAEGERGSADVGV